MNDLALENAIERRSDGMCWSLYYLNKYEVEINDQVAKEIGKSRDCLALLMLYTSGQEEHQARAITFANNLDKKDVYELDQYWMLLYQLFLEGRIGDPYCGERTFSILQEEGVTFLN